MTVAAPAPAVAPPEASDPFADLDKKPRPWWLLLVLLLAVGIGGAVWWRRTHRPAPPSRYVTVRITRGDLSETVEATGTVQPVRSVTVGSQVSGRVLRVPADFDSRVHAGDLLAELDTEPFQALVAQAQATVLSAQASLVRARTDLSLQDQTLARAQHMREQSLNSQSDLDTAVAARAASAAQIGVAQAELARARASLAAQVMNRNYARITAPINGVVVNRTVDPGQTVAASFQAPNLFVIAEDLTHMRVLADIDEADVGKLHEQLGADVRVDAFPGQVFHGVVSQVRFGSTVTSGVVTYPAVIDIDNPDLRLRPGMTATVTLTTQHRTAVLRVPNAALRFRPAEATPPSGGGGSGASGGGRRGRTGGRGGANGGGDGAGRGRVYIQRDGRAVMVRVRTGITDGILTEIEGEGLTENSDLITDETDEAAAATATVRPPGAQSGGGRRMF